MIHAISSFWPWMFENKSVKLPVLSAYNKKYITSNVANIIQAQCKWIKHLHIRGYGG